MMRVFFLFAGCMLAASDGFLFYTNPLETMVNASKAYMNTMTSMYGALWKPFIDANPLLNGGTNPLLSGGSNPLLTGSNPLLGGSNPLLSGSGGSLPGLTGGSLLGGGGSSGGSAAPLEQYNVDKGQISTSGISAGGAMATQMHVIFSKTFMAVGIVAGIPYDCAHGSQMTATTTCMKMPGSLSALQLEHTTDQRAGAGNIDPTANMAGDKVYIFNGRADTVVSPAIGEVTRQYYLHYVTNPTNVKTVFNINAEHGQPTDNYGSSCTSKGTSHYVINCGYSAAYDLLNHIYGGNLQKPAAEYVAKGQLLKYNQGEFSAPSLDGTGYVYIPTACADKTTACKLHVAFHGCQQGASSIGDVYVRHAGYNEVGELNNIIILYPQATTSMLSPMNPMGCFDWWGYAGSNYDVKSGAQVSAVKSMVDRITG